MKVLWGAAPAPVIGNGLIQLAHHTAPYNCRTVMPWSFQASRNSS